MKNTIELIKVAMFASITAILSQIILPVGPVPYSLGLLGALLAGMLCCPSTSTLSMVAYILMGAIGLPVFAGFVGGIGVLINSTGGYLIGYIFISLLTSLARNKKWYVTICAMVLGLLLCYAFGTLWFMAISQNDLVASLAYCVIPFVLPDVAKLVCAFLLGKAIDKRLKFINHK